jgi:hypothetical protein
MRILDLASYVVFAVIIAALTLMAGNAMYQTAHYEFTRPRLSRVAFVPPSRDELEQYKIIQSCNLAEDEAQTIRDMNIRAGGVR